MTGGDVVPSTAAVNSDKPASYLLLHNVGKKQNWGTLLRSAAAFGITDVLVVGGHKVSLHGNQGTSCHTKFRNFDTLKDAKVWLAEKGAKLCGVEIMAESKDVSKHPFTGPTCFMLGNEGIGMNQPQKDACDEFVYIPQYSGATASLNVAIAGSIVFHHFALWADYNEHGRTGEKFDVVQPRGKLEAWLNPTEEEKRELDLKRKARALAKEGKCLKESNDEPVVGSDALNL